MHHSIDRIAHTTAFGTPVVEHWLEREIAQWVHPMKDRSDDPSHHERTLLPRSYISLLIFLECTISRETLEMFAMIQYFCSAKYSCGCGGVGYTYCNLPVKHSVVSFPISSSTHTPGANPAFQIGMGWGGGSKLKRAP